MLLYIPVLRAPILSSLSLQVPKTKCKQVPKKKCKDVPVFVPRKECKDFPKTVCLKDPIQVKKSLPKKVCFSVPEQARSHNRSYTPRAKLRDRVFRAALSFTETTNTKKKLSGSWT